MYAFIQTVFHDNKTVSPSIYGLYDRRTKAIKKAIDYLLLTHVTEGNNKITVKVNDNIVTVDDSETKSSAVVLQVNNW